jgi:hypothetical protein
MRVIPLAAFALLATSCTYDVGNEDFAQVDVSWELTMDGGSVDCAEVGVAVVRVEYRSVSRGHVFADWHPCELHHGRASFLPLDDYAVSVAVLDASGRDLDARALALQLDERRAIELLPAFRFDFRSPASGR